MNPSIHTLIEELKVVVFEKHEVKLRNISRLIVLLPFSASQIANPLQIKKSF